MTRRSAWWAECPIRPRKRLRHGGCVEERQGLARPGPAVRVEWVDRPVREGVHADLEERLGGRAIRLSEPFMKSVIANLDNDWTLGSQDIDAFLRDSEA